MDDDNGFQVTGNAPDAYQRHVRVFMTPLIDLLLERAHVASATSVLDVVCGTGSRPERRPRAWIAPVASLVST